MDDSPIRRRLSLELFQKLWKMGVGIQFEPVSRIPQLLPFRDLFGKTVPLAPDKPQSVVHVYFHIPHARISIM